MVAEPGSVATGGFVKGHTMDAGNSAPRSGRSTALVSALQRTIADRLPAEDQVSFLIASSRLGRGRNVNMDVRRAILNGVFLQFMSFQALAEIPGLSNVHRNPAATVGFPGVDKIPRHGPKGHAQGMNLVTILLAGFTGPFQGRHTLRLVATTQ
jgi:hypothetical protein